MNVGRLAAIFGCAGPALGVDERALFRQNDPFGFILFARNIETPDQVRRLTADLRDAVGRDAPILVDQEGGRVQRLRAPHWREWAPPFDTAMGAGMPAQAARLLAARAMLIGAELRDVGIDCNCAPIADIASDATHPFLRNRCYGTDGAAVSLIARAVADAYLAAGVLPVMKHLPGHGRSIADTHFDLPTVEASADDLFAADFAPFRALADLPMAMTAHIVYAAYDRHRPATQSPVMINVIREVIGFHGLLMTDDLNMQALPGTLAERTALSRAAGCDLALHGKGDMDEMIAVAGAAGEMSDATQARARAALARRIPAPHVDIAALEAKLAAAMPGADHGR
jgi:beta-N-acetylhexosaminidase